MTVKLLIAEDDAELARVIGYSVRALWPDCQVTIAADGAEALRLFTAEAPDLVILDVSMPPPDGFEVCRRIRQISRVPILMLTARDTTIDEVQALDLGADDYLTKPFDYLKLLAHLRALARRATAASVAADAPPAPDFAVGDLAIDFTIREVRVRGEVIELTATEYLLLEELARHAGAVMPHQLLLERVWGAGYTSDIHYLKVFVSRLRQKIGDDAARALHPDPVGHRLPLRPAPLIAGAGAAPRRGGVGIRQPPLTDVDPSVDSLNPHVDTRPLGWTIRGASRRAAPRFPSQTRLLLPSPPLAGPAFRFGTPALDFGGLRLGGGGKG